MGVAAARLVMLDGVDDEGKPTGEGPQRAGSALLPLLGCLGITVARALGYLPLNDPLTRVLLFVPLFTAAIMRLHRQTLQVGAAAAHAAPARASPAALRSRAPAVQLEQPGHARLTRPSPDSARPRRCSGRCPLQWHASGSPFP